MNYLTKKYSFHKLIPILIHFSWHTAKGQNPNLDTAIRHSDWKYVAIGGSLSAGVSSGGIRNQSITASFPALIAKQIGANFTLPMFDKGFEKGTGSLKVVSVSDVIYFVPDENAVVNEERLPAVQGTIGNIAVPFMKVRELAVKETEPGAFTPSFEKKTYRHLDRLLSDNQKGETSYSQVIQERAKSSELFTWELGIDDFVDYYTKGAFGQSVNFVTNEREGYYPERNVLLGLIKNGSKGVIANIPDILSFPYFNMIKSDQLLSRYGEEIYVKRYGGRDSRLLEAGDILLPSVNVTGLISGNPNVGLSSENALEDNEVIGVEEIADTQYYNFLIEKFATESGIAVVDLKGLYIKILKGGFVTEDGVTIDPAFPKGNFFSADGIFPTAIGQAVIANEFIKTINKAYKTNIPLVSVKFIN